MASDQRHNRIFWFGNHVVLSQTELPRFRQLGFEVFNPQYISPIYDQSAEKNWDQHQPTTLPKDIFEKLANYDFFYRDLDDEIAAILNEYFSAVVVTSNYMWLKPMLDKFLGKIIFRVYGQTHTLSNELFKLGYFSKVQERQNFWLVPHAEEAVELEHEWLKERRIEVPYTLPPDVYDHRDTWQTDPAKRRPEIMALCPNIRNTYYEEHFKFLNDNFPQKSLRLYGIQPKDVKHERLVGYLPRQEHLEAYKESCGHFYTHQDPRVCYLPPIEMMTIGGPVLFLPGSLLAKYYTKKAPALCVDKNDAARKMRYLLDGDQTFIAEILANQEEVRRRYAPEYVNPIFDRVFLKLLNPSTEQPAPLPVIASVESISAHRYTLGVLFHFEQTPIEFVDGEYRATDDIASETRDVVWEQIEKHKAKVLITCFSEQLQLVYGYFSDSRHRGSIQIIPMGRYSITSESKLPNSDVGFRIETRIQSSFGPLDPLIRPARKLEFALIQTRTKLEASGKVARKSATLLAARTALKINGVGIASAKAFNRTSGHSTLFWKKNILGPIQRIRTVRAMSSRCETILIPNSWSFPETALLGDQAVTLEQKPDATNGIKDKIARLIAARAKSRSRAWPAQ